MSRGTLFDNLQGLIEENPALDVEIDLEAGCVTAADFSFEAKMPEAAR